MSAVRQPAVAGIFYPADREELRAAVAHYLAAAGADGGVPKAIIAPHAGYIYSGPIAASVYARLAPARDRITRVVLIGPSHRVALRGLAVPGATAFATPLGSVPVDRSAIDDLLQLPQVTVLDEAHALEHSLEVHLPFLQQLLDDFSIVPLVAGDATPDETGEVIDRLWGGPETLIVVSSDLSHYRDYATARRLDAETSRAITECRPEAIRPEHACGRIPITGLLTVAGRRGVEVRAIDLRNSGDTAGPRDQVVGYGAYVVGQGR